LRPVAAEHNRHTSLRVVAGRIVVAANLLAGRSSRQNHDAQYATCGQGTRACHPTFVANNADLRWTIDTAAHEWLHQYLAFKPLGFRYVLDLLGIAHNYEIGTHVPGNADRDRVDQSAIYQIPALPPDASQQPKSLDLKTQTVQLIQENPSKAVGIIREWINEGKDA
jgi:hypothetical protein